MQVNLSEENKCICYEMKKWIDQLLYRLKADSNLKKMQENFLMTFNNSRRYGGPE